MEELKQMSVNEICDMLKIYCDEHFETQSVVNWKFINADNLPICRVNYQIICLFIIQFYVHIIPLF